MRTHTLTMGTFQGEKVLLCLRDKMALVQRIRLNLQFQGRQGIGLVSLVLMRHG